MRSRKAEDILEADPAGLALADRNLSTVWAGAAGPMGGPQVTEGACQVAAAGLEVAGE